MERDITTILVTGATGHQGGAATRHLLDDGWHARALTRHPDSLAARILADLGAEVVQGDLLDRASVDRAVAGCWGVHSVETFREAGAEGEVREGRNLVDAAVAAGVQFFVYDSVAGAGQPSEMGYVRSKQALEAYLRDSALRYAVWRPVTFMENLLGQRDAIAAGKLTGYEPPEQRHQYIAVDDIGAFVALAFADPDRWAGKATVIASDDLRMNQVAEVLGRVVGHDVRYERQQPPAEMEAAAKGQTERADMPLMRDLVPDLKTLEAWARGVRWETQPAGAPR